MASFTSLLPLLILFLVVGGAAFIAYQVYLWSNEMTDRGKRHMEKKHMSFTKEGGLKVGVKERSVEGETDRTQNVLVNVWNNANVGGGDKKGGSGKDSPRPSGSRTTSAAQTPAQMAARGVGSSTELAAPSSSTKRSTSPVPGGWQ